jgi:hypothetical protein
MTTPAKTILNAFNEAKERSPSTKSSWVKDNPVSASDTQNKLHDITSKIHTFCLMNRFTVDHPVVGAKVFSLLSDAFPNTPPAMHGIYAQRVTRELRAKVAHYR